MGFVIKFFVHIRVVRGVWAVISMPGVTLSSFGGLHVAFGAAVPLSTCIGRHKTEVDMVAPYNFHLLTHLARPRLLVIRTPDLSAPCISYVGVSYFIRFFMFSNIYQ